MPFESGTIELVSFIGSSSFAFPCGLRYQSEDFRGYQILFFDTSLDVKTEYLGFDGFSSIGSIETLSNGGPFIVDLNPLFKLVLFATILKDGPKIDPIVYAGRQYGSEGLHFRNRLGIFLTLACLSALDVQVEDDEIYDDFTMSLEGYGDIKQPIHASLLQHPSHSVMLANLSFTNRSVRRSRVVAVYFSLRPTVVQKCIEVLKLANERAGGTAFAQDDYQFAKDEMNFSLRPDTNSIDESYSRIDFWCLGEGQTQNIIGIIGLLWGTYKSDHNFAGFDAPYLWHLLPRSGVTRLAAQARLFQQ